MKKISIVMPVHNGEKYISQAIESVLQQSYENWELIIVNDCSTDGTSRIINDYEKKVTRIRVYNNDRNLKLPATLNVGFGYAKGEYFTWTSDDNILLPQFLEVLNRYLNDNEQVDFVYSDYIGIDSEGNELGVRHMLEPENMIYKNSVGASFLYRRKIYDEIGGYSPEWFLVEDYEYWLRVYKQYRMMHVEDILYQYRFHDQSLSKTRLESIIQQTFKMKLYNLPYIAQKIANKEKRYLYFDEIVRALGEEETLRKCLDIDSTYQNHYKLYQKREHLKKMFPTVMQDIVQRIFSKIDNNKIKREDKSIE